jgi:SAM-dependent methyltransferase
MSQELKENVRKAYGKIASTGSGCCGGPAPKADAFAQGLGYTPEELAAVPDGANLALSCGHPTAIAGLKAGETVLDLGSGAGFDCFVASKKVGPTGKVIGVDMTPEMLEKARENARRGGFGNVEFRRGEIEDLPVDDGTIDAVISNCVINLSTDKKRVFREIARVLKPGGRVMIADMALKRELPPSVREDIKSYVGCVSGAVPVDEYRSLLVEAGLKDVRITPKGASDCGAPESAATLNDGLKGRQEGYALSVEVEGRK